MQKSEIETFQTVFYLDCIEKYNDVSDKPFYKAEEYEEKQANIVTPLGLNFNGFVQCLALPSIVGWQLENICAIACATAVLCIPGVAVATGFGVGEVTTSNKKERNWKGGSTCKYFYPSFL